MILLKELLRKYRGQGLLLLPIAVASTLAGLLFIEMGRRVINVVASPEMAAGPDYHHLLLYCLVILGSMFASGIINYWIEVLFVRLSQSILRDIRVKLFNHFLQLPQNFHNDHPVGQLMSLIINDVGYIGQFFSKGLLSPVMNLFLVLFSATYLFYLNWKLATAAIITVTLVVFFLPRFNRRLGELSEQYSNSMGNLSNYVQEALSGIPDIRANQTYQFEEARLIDKIKDFFGINLELAKTAGKLGFLMEVIRGSGPLLVYLYGGILCLRGEMSVGTLVATITVIYTLYGPVGSFVGFLQEWRQVKVRFDKLDDYLGMAPEEEVIPAAASLRTPPGALRFDQVHFGFSEGEVLLKDLNFQTAPGESLALVGPSGSGKSLTAALISRTYRPLSGRIELGEDDLENIPLYALRAQIGHVSQTPFLFNDTLKGNILYSLLRKPGTDGDTSAAWVDFSALAGVDGVKALDREIIRVVREVGLFEDIYELGLRSKLSSCRSEAAEENKWLILKARARFIEETSGRGWEYLEHYNPDKFLEYCSILGNIVYGPARQVITEFGSIQGFCDKYLNERLGESGLLEKLFQLGVHLARADSFLLEELHKKKSPLLGRLDLDAETLQIKMKIKNQKVLLTAAPRMSRLDPALAGDILELAYRYVPGKAKEDLLDDRLRQEILAARKSFRAHLPAGLQGKFTFFDPLSFMDALTLRENIIFGNINPLRKKANEAVNALIRKIAAEEGLEELILNVGLEFKVGERGNKLSGGQRQKVAIARTLFKNPGIVILDEATANLDGASQACISELVKEKFRDQIVIAIAHRLGIIRDYDTILVFDQGNIVQQGSFAELINQDGLFKKLCEESA